MIKHTHCFEDEPLLNEIIKKNFCDWENSKLVDEKGAAQFLGFTPRALQAWRHRGNGPVFVRISSRAVRYRRKDLVAWAEQRLCQNTAANTQNSKNPKENHESSGHRAIKILCEAYLETASFEESICIKKVLDIANKCFRE